MNKWHQLIVSDPDFLSGESVHSLTTKIVLNFGIKWIGVSDIEGAVWGLAARSRSLMPAHEFEKLVKQAAQYDWAFFFMYSNGRSAIEESDLLNLQLSDLTVRLADNTDFFIYTRNAKTASLLQQWYPSAQHTLSRFENLNIPY